MHSEVALLKVSGLTEEEIADHLGVTNRTVRNHWLFAKAWLKRELGS